MKYRNNWKNTFRYCQSPLMLRFRLLGIDWFSLEIDIVRNFYLLTVLNFTIKNR